MSELRGLLSPGSSSLGQGDLWWRWQPLSNKHATFLDLALSIRFCCTDAGMNCLEGTPITFRQSWMGATTETWHSHFLGSRVCWHRDPQDTAFPVTPPWSPPASTHLSTLPAGSSTWRKRELQGGECRWRGRTGSVHVPPVNMKHMCGVQVDVAPYWLISLSQVFLLYCSVHCKVVTWVGIQQNTHRSKNANRPHARHPDESLGHCGVWQGHLCVLSSSRRCSCGYHVTRVTGRCSRMDGLTP